MIRIIFLIAVAGIAACTANYFADKVNRMVFR